MLLFKPQLAPYRYVCKWFRRCADLNVRQFVVTGRLRLLMARKASLPGGDGSSILWANISRYSSCASLQLHTTLGRVPGIDTATCQPYISCRLCRATHRSRLCFTGTADAFADGSRSAPLSITAARPPRVRAHHQAGGLGLARVQGAHTLKPERLLRAEKPAGLAGVPPPATQLARGSLGRATPGPSRRVERSGLVPSRARRVSDTVSQSVTAYVLPPCRRAARASRT